MTGCLNMSLPEYQLLKKLSGIPEDELKYFIRGFMLRNGDSRLPTLDEIPGANSEPYIREFLGLTQTSNVVEKGRLLELTGTESVRDANKSLNNVFRDKEIKLLELPSGVIVNILNRPKVNGEFNPDFERIDVVNSAHFFNDQIYRLANLYGIQINTVNLNDELFNIMPMARGAKAFVYNGNIYLNTDNATVEDPVHELMHILLGSMKYSDTLKYYDIVNSIESIPNYVELAKLYDNRTRADRNEEIFVREVSKALMGLPSSLSKLDGNSLYEIEKSALFTLDSLLQGNVSALNVLNVFRQPLKTVANLVQANAMVNKFEGTINGLDAAKHRKSANLKHKLMQEGKLIEECS